MLPRRMCSRMSFQSAGEVSGNASVSMTLLQFLIEAWKSMSRRRERIFSCSVRRRGPQRIPGSGRRLRCWRRLAYGCLPHPRRPRGGRSRRRHEWRQRSLVHLLLVVAIGFTPSGRSLMALAPVLPPTHA